MEASADTILASHQESGDSWCGGAGAVPQFSPEGAGGRGAWVAIPTCTSHALEGVAGEVFWAQSLVADVMDMHGPAFNIDEAALMSWLTNDTVQKHDAGLVSPTLPSGDPMMGCREAFTESPVPEARMQGMDLKWMCAVKNSFLHVELGSDCDSLCESGSDTASSQRASSVPIRSRYSEPCQQWHRRHSDRGAEQSQSQRYTDNLESFNFAWGAPRVLVAAQ